MKDSALTAKKHPDGKIGLLTWIFQWENILLVLFLLLILVFSNLSPYFFDTYNILNTTFNFMEKALIALPMMMVILCGEIDISVASIISVSSLFMGMAAKSGCGSLMLVCIGILVGGFAGALNGVLVSYVGVPSIAVTIGTMSLFRGISYAVLGDKAYTAYPEEFAYVGQGYVFNTMIPFQLVVFIFFAFIFYILIHKMSFGRKLYALGNNDTAAHFSGINVKKYVFAAFLLNGIFSGLAAVLLTSRIGSTRPNIANGWELEIITTVVLGGVSITGGSGKLRGVIAAIFLLGFLKFGMGLLNVPGKIMNVITGFLLIIAILLPGLVKNFQDIFNRNRFHGKTGV